jgi:hypothetical protein
MRKHGIRISTALAVVASLALVVPATAGQPVKAKLKITEVSATGAKGTLKSKKLKCQKRRKVALKLQGEYSSTRVGTDKTNRRGRWKVNATLQQGEYYFATAAPVKRGDVKCRGTASNSVQFTG